MKSGRLLNKIEIQEAQKQRNELGELVINWVTWLTVWAQIRPLAGAEFWNAAQVQAEVSHKLNIRWTDRTDSAGQTISRLHRVKMGNRIFDINAVMNIEERNREMVLMVKESA